MYTEKDINKCSKKINSIINANRIFGINELKNIVVNSENEEIAVLAINELYNVANNLTHKNNENAITNLAELACTNTNNNIAVIATEKLVNISNNNDFVYNELKNITIKSNNIEVIELITNTFEQILGSDKEKVDTFQHIKRHTNSKFTKELMESKILEIEPNHYELSNILDKAINDPNLEAYIRKNTKPHIQKNTTGC